MASILSEKKIELLMTNLGVVILMGLGSQFDRLRWFAQRDAICWQVGLLESPNGNTTIVLFGHSHSIFEAFGLCWRSVTSSFQIIQMPQEPVSRKDCWASRPSLSEIESVKQKLRWLTSIQLSFWFHISDSYTLFMVGVVLSSSLNSYASRFMP
jgi:hypothetical protein